MADVKEDDWFSLSLKAVTFIAVIVVMVKVGFRSDPAEAPTRAPTVSTAPAEPVVPAMPPAPILTMAQRFPGPWVEGVTPGIVGALVANHVRGCPYLRYKASVQDERSYLVQCSRDNANWRAYVVWTGVDEVQEIPLGWGQ